MNSISGSVLVRHPLLWIALAGGVLQWLVLPAGVATMNDDFGYLSSVVETLRHGRPWTDDWLEPWSASLAGASALLYKLTGSFRFAIQGLQVAAAGAAAVAAWCLFRARGFSSGSAAGVALLALSSPAWMWKTTEYTGMVLHLPCLLWAAWAAGERRWGFFFFVWFLAVATRQSAVAWLALPAWAAVTGFRGKAGPGESWHRPVVVLVAGLCALLFLSAVMNQTQSQRLVTGHLGARWPVFVSWRNLGFGIGIGMVAMGLGALLPACLAGGAAPRALACRFGLLVAAAAVGATFIGPMNELFHEHSAYDGWTGRLYANLLLAASFGGWLLMRGFFRGDMLFAALAALALVMVRHEVWDYYFIDLAVFALLAVQSHRPAADEAPTPWPTSVVLAAGTVLACFHFWFAYQSKCRVDRDWAICVLSERALRSGGLQVNEIEHTPFGFIGWQLHRHFVAHAGRDDADIGGFMRYQRHGVTETLEGPRRFWRGSRSLRPPVRPGAERIIVGDVFTVGWVWYQRFSVLRAAGPSTPAALPLDAEPERMRRRLPLDDREWNEAVVGSPH